MKFGVSNLFMIQACYMICSAEGPWSPPDTGCYLVLPECQNIGKKFRSPSLGRGVNKKDARTGF
jgi:hypothetical protein